MAADCRNSDTNTVISDTVVSDAPAHADFPARLSRYVVFGNGTGITLTDYASAGADWNAESREITAGFDTESITSNG